MSSDVDVVDWSSQISPLYTQKAMSQFRVTPEGGSRSVANRIGSPGKLKFWTKENFLNFKNFLLW